MVTMKDSDMTKDANISLHVIMFTNCNIEKKGTLAGGGGARSESPPSSTL
jgi:hypothetical protein